MRQMSAVTGIRKKPRYRDIIEAQTPFLPAKYQLKQEEKYRGESLALERDRLAKEEELGLQALEEQEKQAKTSTAIGLGQLGVTGYFAHQQKKALGGLGGAKEVAKTPWMSKVEKPTVTSPGGGLQPSKITPGFFSKEGLTSKAGWGQAATSWAPYAGGATGIAFGGKLGEKYIPRGSERTKKFLGGGLTGAGAGYMFSGGDPYSTAISFFIGGIGSLF